MMWYKNASFFRISDFKMSAEELSDCMEQLLFRPCGENTPSSHGWASPFGEGKEMLVMASQGRFGIRLKIQEKIVPKDVLREKARAEVIEEEYRAGKTLSKKEKDDIKVLIYNKMLKVAFTRDSDVHGFIDSKTGLMVVNSTNKKSIELFKDSLCKISDNEMRPKEIMVSDQININMSSWVFDESNDTQPSNWQLNDRCVLKVPNEPGSIRYNNHNLDDENVRTYISIGNQVTELGLKWADMMQFVLTEKLVVKGIKFLDRPIMEYAEIDIPDTEDARAIELDAKFNIMCGVFMDFAPILFSAFGGERGKDEKIFPAEDLKAA